MIAELTTTATKNGTSPIFANFVVSLLLPLWHRLHGVERVVGHAPFAVRLAAIDSQEVPASFGRVAAGLWRGGDGVGAALIRQVAGDDGLHRRPGLVDLDLLKRTAICRVVRGLAHERGPARRDHDVVLVRE